MIERIYRQPQKKDVHVYHIIAKNTPDVFLNKLCIGKSQIMDSFTKMSPTVRKSS